VPSYFKAVIWSVVLSLLGYAGWIALSEKEQIALALSNLSWVDTCIILALSLVNYFLRFVRWQYYLVQLGHSVPIFQSLLIYLAGFALTTTPGKAGEAIRSLYLKPFGIDYASSLAAFTTERVSDIISMVLISILALYTFHQYSWLAILLTTVTFSFVLMIQFGILSKFILRFTFDTRHERVKKAANAVLSLLNVIQPLVTHRALLIGTLIGLIAWGAEAFALSYLVSALGYPTPVFLTAGIYAIAVIVGAVAFLPGGLGGTEAAMSLLLIAAGLNHETALTATIVCRLTTLWFAVIIGMIIMLWMTLRPQLIQPKISSP